MYQIRACPGFLIGGKTGGLKADSGDGGLGEGAATPPHQPGSLRSAVSFAAGFGTEPKSFPLFLHSGWPLLTL